MLVNRRANGVAVWAVVLVVAGCFVLPGRSWSDQPKRLVDLVQALPKSEKVERDVLVKWGQRLAVATAEDLGAMWGREFSELEPILEAGLQARSWLEKQPDPAAQFLSLRIQFVMESVILNAVYKAPFWKTEGAAAQEASAKSRRQAEGMRSLEWLEKNKIDERASVKRALDLHGAIAQAFTAKGWTPETILKGRGAWNIEDEFKEMIWDHGLPYLHLGQGMPIEDLLLIETLKGIDWARDTRLLVRALLASDHEPYTAESLSNAIEAEIGADPEPRVTTWKKSSDNLVRSTFSQRTSRKEEEYRMRILLHLVDFFPREVSDMALYKWLGPQRGWAWGDP